MSILCRIFGCDMQFAGGKMCPKESYDHETIHNVDINECARCGASDYGYPFMKKYCVGCDPEFGYNCEVIE